MIKTLLLACVFSILAVLLPIFNFPNLRTSQLTPTPTEQVVLPSGPIEVKLTWNTRADVRLLIRDPSGTSVFVDNRTPDNSGILERLGNFKCFSTTNTPLTYAYWPQDRSASSLVGTYEVVVLLEDRCEDEANLPEFTLTVNVNGKQIIDITEFPDPNKAFFLTTFTIDTDNKVAVGKAGIVRNQFSRDISVQINNNPPVLQFTSPISGKLDSQTPFLVYTFDAKAEQRIAIVMRSTSGSLDTNLFLLNSKGVQLAANDDAPNQGTNSRIEYRVDADGTYVIVATRWGVELGGTQGNFELTVAQLNR